MQKFNKGDVIIRHNKFYVASMITEEEVLFKAYSFQSFFGFAGIAGCGDDVSCTDHFIYSRASFSNHSGFDENTGRYIGRNEGSYPIVGTYLDKCCNTLLINYCTLKQFYPEVYKRFLIAELDRFVDTTPLVPIEAPALKVVHKQSKTKKNANKRSISKNKSRSGKR